MKSPQMSSKSGGGKAHCVVCGDESSGFHYGVDSCEGCKGFFRRCITQGMNHKCANEEKCEITPFTRNSCQYCRLKKCFEVGMSREASRLGRRPKRLKEVGGEGSGGSRVGNLPIAPYPAPQDMNRMRMEQLQKILQSGRSLKEDLMQAFVSVAKASFQEHSKTGEKGKGCENQPEQKPVVTECTPMDVLASVSSVVASSSSASAESRSASVDSVVQGGMDADSPSSLNSPGGSSCIRDLNLTAFENFLFEQGMPSTPGSAQQILLDSIGDLQALNSPYNPGSVGGLDYVSAATSPVSDLGLGSPLILPSSSSVANDGVVLVNDIPNTAGALTLNTLTLNPQNMCAPAPQVCSQTQQQQQQQQHFLQTPMSTPQNNNTAPTAAGATGIRGEAKTEIKTEIKTEPNGNFSSSCMVKKELVSPKTRPSRLASFAINDESKYVIDVKSIMDEVRQTPTETRRQLIEQVTDAVVDAHVHTTINTHKSIEEANQRIERDLQKQSGNEESNLLKVRADYLWHQFVSAMVPEITKVVKFSKKLPGFQEIEQDDQIRLIKQGAFEVMMCRFAMLVDAVNQTVLDPKLTTRCPREVIQATPMGEFLDEFFYVATRFNPLRLTDGEVGLFTSVLIVCPSRKGLKNKIAIGKIQTLFQQALYILMKHNHPDAEERFERLMGLIGIFRRINDEHFKAINEIRLSLPPETSFPALHEEIFDNSY